MPDLVEVPASDADLLDRIGRLRARAWQTEATFSGNADAWLDDYDPVATHFAFFADGQLSAEGPLIATGRLIADGSPIAAARLTVHPSVRDVPRADIQDHAFPHEPPLPVAFLSRLVVDPDHRRQGLGTRLDEARLARARELRCGCAVTRPVDDRRTKQLERLGFTIVGRCKPIESGPVRTAGHPVMLLVF